MLRTFFAVNIGETTRTSLSTFAQELKKRLLPERIRVSWVDPKMMHITLRFLGETKEEDVPRLGEIAKAAVLGIPAFTVRVGGLDFFPSAHKPRVLFCNGEARELGIIAEQLEERLVKAGFPKADFPHRAHITLGRIKDDRPPSGLAAKLTQNHPQEHPSFIVSEVILYKSETLPSGPVYTPIVKIPLE